MSHEATNRDPMSCETWRSRLDAYIDGEASRKESAAIEQHLETCGDCAREALARTQLKNATRAAAMRFAPSPELRMQVQGMLRKQRRSPWQVAWRPAMLAVAAVLLLAVAVSLAYTRQSARSREVAELFDLHVATLASANPVDVISTDRHTVKPWFQGKLPFSFNVPELGGTEFKLIGGRVAYVEQTQAAQLLFTAGKHDVTVFLEQDNGSNPLRSLEDGSARERGFNIETWTAKGLRCQLISDANAGDLHALSDLIRNANR